MKDEETSRHTKIVKARKIAHQKCFRALDSYGTESLISQAETISLSSVKPSDEKTDDGMFPLRSDLIKQDLITLN